MKIQNMKKKGKRGLRAILCGLVCLLCVVYMDMNVRAEVNMEDYPSVYLSPDGTAWSAYDELPYYEDYNVMSYPRGYKFSFWIEANTKIETGVPLQPPTVGVGQHLYDVRRTGEVPVAYWIVNWMEGRCIHDGVDNGYKGFPVATLHKCGHAYWSGLKPYCVYCEGELSEFIYYIKPETAAGIKSIDLDMGYFYLCPHEENHNGAKME